MTHCPGLSLGPGGSAGLARKPLRVTGARLSGKKGWGFSQTKIYGPDHNNERKKKKGRVFGNAQGPGLLPYYQKCRRSLDSAN